jgi:GNAT superfamily N-acetyltransferase
MPSITLHSTQQPAIGRPYRDEGDFWRVRELLLETYPISPPDFNWEVRRWDGSRFHYAGATWGPYWEGRVRLWETAQGRPVGAAHPDDEGMACLQVHPDWRHIEDEMLAWAEEHIGVATPDGAGQRVDVYAYEYDSWRRHLLEKRGYQKTTDWGVMRRLRFGEKLLPAAKMPAGYTLRSAHADDPAEHEEFAALLNAAFNRTIHKAEHTRLFRQAAPSYRADLDLFAIAPDGALAANVGVIYMPEVRAGLYEPVCTHPAHRQKGLAQALMWEGMQRLRALGATEVTVGTGDMAPANALYESVGFPEAYRGYVWRKVW